MSAKILGAFLKRIGRLGVGERLDLNGAADVVFPPVCVGCHGLVESNPPFRHLCSRCTAQLPRVSPPACEVCGHPFFGDVAGERTCPHCEGLRPAFRRGCTAVVFRGAARSIVIELKYHRGLHVLPDMEAIVRSSPHVLDHVRDAVLVPVPLHPRKERERGFNQCSLIADLFVRAAGGTTRVQPCLQRVVDTVTQTAFDRRHRMENLKNAFALLPGTHILPDQHYILVDDVFTTGSTLNSCARVLRNAGCLTLDVVTFGHG